MNHHRIDNEEQQPAQSIKKQTTAALQSNFPTLHTRFRSDVSYPPENYEALVYFNTIHAMEEYNLTKDENAFTCIKNIP